MAFRAVAPFPSVRGFGESKESHLVVTKDETDSIDYFVVVGVGFIRFRKLFERRFWDVGEIAREEEFVNDYQ
jgi:hypothetical protein